VFCPQTALPLASVLKFVDGSMMLYSVIVLIVIDMKKHNLVTLALFMIAVNLLNATDKADVWQWSIDTPLDKHQRGGKAFLTI
jgi:hypothetical protein